MLLRLGTDGARVVYRQGASLPAVGEALRFAGLPLDVAEVDIATFDQALSEAYQQDSSAGMQMVEGLGDDMDLASLAELLPETEELMEQEDDAPILRLINAVLSEAVKENASDIHVETFEKRLLRQMVEPRCDLAGWLVSWIKVVAKQNIAEKRCQAVVTAMGWGCWHQKT